MFFCIVDKIDSTNAYAKEILLSKLINRPFAILAHEQIAGRGKLGANWYSFRGNLHLSLVLKRGDIFKDISSCGLISLCFSLAIRELLQEYIFDKYIFLSKWPNDVLVKNAKISGTLLEIEKVEGIDYLIVGIGVNLIKAPYMEAYPTISLYDLLGKEIDNIDFANKLVKKSLYFLQYISEDTKFLIERWKSRAYRYSEEINIKAQGVTHGGIFEDITEEGYLILNQDGIRKKFTTGDIYGL